MELVIIQNQQAVTTSLQVAEAFEKQHKHVLEAIENKISSAENSAQYQNMFLEDVYRDKSGKSNKMYLMNKDGWAFIAMGFTGRKADEFKLQYIAEFNRMESHIKDSREKLPSNPREILKLMFQVTEETQEEVEKVKGRVTDLEENTVLSAGDYSYISRRINQRVAEVAKGFGKITQLQRGELHKDINSGVKKITGVSTRTQLRQKHFQIVVDYISDWEPSTATKTVVRQMNLLDEVV